MRIKPTDEVHELYKKKHSKSPLKKMSKATLLRDNYERLVSYKKYISAIAMCDVLFISLN